MQRLAGGLLAITDHLAQVGQLSRLLAGRCLELADLLGQRLIPFCNGSLGFQERSVERPVILFQGGFQLGYPLGQRLVSLAQGAAALFQGGVSLAVGSLVIGLELG